MCWKGHLEVIKSNPLQKQVYYNIWGDVGCAEKQVFLQKSIDISKKLEYESKNCNIAKVL